MDPDHTSSQICSANLFNPLKGEHEKLAYTCYPPDMSFSFNQFLYFEYPVYFPQTHLHIRTGQVGLFPRDQSTQIPLVHINYIFISSEIGRQEEK